MKPILGYFQGTPIYDRRYESKEKEESTGGAEIAADLMATDEEEDALDKAVQNA